MSNDVSIFATIVIILFSVGALLPLIKTSFYDDSTSVDINGFTEDSIQGAADLNPLSFIASGLKMIFFSWGEVPLFLEILLWSMRFVAAFIFARLLRGTG